MLFVVSSDRFAGHVTPPGRSERAARAHVMDAVAADCAARRIPVLAPRPATLEELLRVHSPAYLEKLITTVAGRATVLDGDTCTSPQSVDTAVLAAGAAVAAVDRVLDAPFDDQPPQCGLVLVRPPGHHAQASRAMGFCLLNNVAVAAAHALSRGANRVAVIDYDVHHGNGTQWMFYGEPRVLMISTHQFPFYPGSGSVEEAGAGDGQGFTVNVPLVAGATDGDYHLVFDRIVLPLLDAFQPELLLVSAGFDAHMRDPLACMRVSVAGFNGLASRLRDRAVAARIPMVVVTEGGYHLKVLARCLLGLVDVFTDAPHNEHELPSARPEQVPALGASVEPLSADEAPLVEVPTPDATNRGPVAIELVRGIQRRYWPGL